MKFAYLSTTVSRKRVVPEALVRAFDGLLIVVVMRVCLANGQSSDSGGVLHYANTRTRSDTLMRGAESARRSEL